MGTVRCNGCREWFDRKLAECPACETRRPGFNSWLRTAGLNNQLYDQARSAEREKKFERALAARR